MKGSLLVATEHLTILSVIGSVSMLIIMKYKKISLLGPEGSQRKWLLVRGAIRVVGLLSLYFALSLIPPSDCNAILHSSVILTAILSRIIFKEKLSFTHVIAIAFTVTGIIFILKPTAIFGSTITIKNETFNNNSIETNKNNNSFIIQNSLPIGITCSILTAILFTLTNLIMKKLCKKKLHWCYQTAFGSYVGLPIALLISVSLFLSGQSHKKDSVDNVNMYYLHIFYSILSGIFGNLGQIALNFALMYEEPTKVAIIKTTDVLFSFLLQLVILNISIDSLSVIGSFAILVGTCLVLIFKIFYQRSMKTTSDQTGETSQHQQQNKEKSCLKKCFLFTF
jgi:drug/metabolite transporter (DMT)-like permease